MSSYPNDHPVTVTIADGKGMTLDRFSGRAYSLPLTEDDSLDLDNATVGRIIVAAIDLARQGRSFSVSIKSR